MQVSWKTLAGVCESRGLWSQSETYAVVLLMSWTLCSGSMVSGQRRMQGAKTMARALTDILLVSSCREILQHNTVKTHAESAIQTSGIQHWTNTKNWTVSFLGLIPYLTRWKMRRSRVLRCVRLSWSMTEYTPWITSRLSGWPGNTRPTSGAQTGFLYITLCQNSSFSASGFQRFQPFSANMEEWTQKHGGICGTYFYSSGWTDRL